MGPKWVPNRIFDAEALRKPLGALLERSWTLLEPKKTNLEPLLGRLGAPLDAYKPLYHEPVLARDRKARSWKSLSHACLMTSQLAPKMILEVSWGPPGLLDWSGNDSTYLFVSRALYVFGYLFEAEKYTNNNSPTGPKIVKIIPRWLQNPPQMAP